MSDHDNHRQRIRDRFFNEGLENWDPYLQLELFLTLGVPRKDTKPLANELLRRFGSLAEVMDASPEELQKIKGVGPAVINLLKITREISRAYITSQATHGNILNQPDLVVDMLRADLKSQHNEQVRLLFLDTANKLIANEVLFEGTLNQAPLYPRTIVEKTIEHKAAGIILAHNHPGGTLRASAEDISITKDITAALATIDVRLLDHFIITRNGWLSFQKEGLL